MKRNAIGRIIVFSVLALVLTGILISGILGGNESGITLDGEAYVDVAGIKNLEINWAAGSVEVRTGEGDSITIFENGNNSKYNAVYSIYDDTLIIDYCGSHGTVGNIEEKHLIVTVPNDWYCHKMELNCAALDIRLSDLQIGCLELDGAGCDLTFTGSIGELCVDGAAVKLSVFCQNRLSEVEINGTGCKLNLTLPPNCGFRVDTNGLGCDFNSDLPGIAQNGTYTYGSQHCKIDIDGLGCEVTIFEADAETSLN
ncbi:MAG: hypothetical protein IKY59_04870 [Oscillospiraceae bacterium]|nr:hypothetical protein [Oscillospiraceae bacterium]